MIGRFFLGLWIWVLRIISLDGLVEWHRIPRPLGVIRLVAYPTVFRRDDMYDTSPGMSKDAPAPGKDYRTARMPGGRYNDLDDPKMGNAGARFCHNREKGHVTNGQRNR